MTTTNMLRLAAGNGQVANSSGSNHLVQFQPLIVQVVDGPTGRGVPNTPVTWTFQTSLPGGTIVSARVANGGTTATDASGNAAILALQYIGPVCAILATAKAGDQTVVFQLQANTGLTSVMRLLSGDGQNVTGRNGSSVPFMPLVFQLFDMSTGRGQPNLQIGWTFQMTPPGGTIVAGGQQNATVTDANGNVVLQGLTYTGPSCDIVATANAGGTTISFHLRVNIAINYTAALLSGDRQSVPSLGSSNTVQFAPLLFKMTDGPGGGALANLPVVWSFQMTPPGGTLVPGAGTYPNMNATGADGVAALGALQYSGPTCDIVATATSAGIATAFHLHAAIGQMQIVGGDGQKADRMGASVPGGTASFAPLSVRLTDGLGNPAANQQVTWSLGAVQPPLSATLDAGTMSTSNADGVAVLQDAAGVRSCHAVGANGSFAVTATAGPFSATFNLRVMTVNIAILNGNGQTGDVMTDPHDTRFLPRASLRDTYFQPLSIKLTDETGAAVVGRQVLWSVSQSPQGMSVVFDSPYGTSTDETGVTSLGDTAANYAFHTEDGLGGTFAVQANAGSANAQFTLTARPWQPLNQQDGTSLPDGTLFRISHQPVQYDPGRSTAPAPITIQVNNALAASLVSYVIYWNVDTIPVDPAWGPAAPIDTDGHQRLILLLQQPRLIFRYVEANCDYFSVFVQINGSIATFGFFKAIAPP